MLPETIDDLLDLADNDLGAETESARRAAVLRSAAPSLVLLAQADGALVFADDFGADLGDRLASDLARQLATRLRERRTCAFDVQTRRGPRRCVGVRLPRLASDAVLGCLAESSEAADASGGDAAAALDVCHALAWAGARRQRCEAELTARIEQLTAGQEALRASYAHGLAEAIDEHEQRLREQEAARQQLLQAQKLESIGQLAAGIAHEINTPTQFIGDNLRFLADAFADLQSLWDAVGRLPAAAASIPETLDLPYLLEEVPRAIAQSLEGVERVANIVRSMKEFSHPGSDEMQPVDLNRALASTLTVCRNEWKYVADAVTDFDPQLPLVNCLPGACNQVFLNLIINAAHAIADKQRQGADDKGLIAIRTRSEGEWVEIRVSDTGTGISEQFRAKVFDPFFTTKEVGRGTGQGLAIARSVVVDKHGGTLTFETETGRGATFIVRLPVTSQAPSPT